MGDATINQTFMTTKERNQLLELQAEIAKYSKKDKDGKLKNETKYNKAKKELQSLWTSIHAKRQGLTTTAYSTAPVKKDLDKNFNSFVDQAAPYESEYLKDVKKLSRADRKVLKELNKNVKKANEALIKATNLEVETQEAQKNKDKNILDCKEKLQKAIARYELECNRLSIPLNPALYETVLSTQAVEGLEQIGDVLETKKMDKAPHIKTTLKSDTYKYTTNYQEQVIEANEKIETGVAGLKEKTKDQINSRFGVTAEFVEKMEEISGIDRIFQKNANEKEHLETYMNYKAVLKHPKNKELGEIFGNEYINKNRNRTFGEIYQDNKDGVAFVAGKEAVKFEDIKTVTLLTGKRVDANEINDIKLNDILLIETKDGVVINSEPKSINKGDLDYITYNQCKEAAKEVGFKFEKNINFGKALQESAPVALATGIATAFPVAKIRTLLEFHQIGGDSDINKLTETLEKLKNKKGWVVEQTADEVHATKRVKIDAYGIGIAATAVAAELLTNILKQYVDKGTIPASYDDYKTLFEQLPQNTLENIKGGIGGVLSPEEAKIMQAKIIAGVEGIINELKNQPIEPVAPTPAPQPEVKKAEVNIYKKETPDSCIYKNKPSESWYSISQGFKDDDGKFVTRDSADHKELLNAIRSWNKGKATEGGMPKDVKIEQTTYKTKSGNTYTFQWCDGCPEDVYQTLLDNEAKALAKKLEKDSNYQVPNFYPARVDLKKREEAQYIVETKKDDENYGSKHDNVTDARQQAATEVSTLEKDKYETTDNTKKIMELGVKAWNELMNKLGLK